MRSYDFFLEHRLKELNRELADRYTCCAFVFEQMLKNLSIVFPHFTDHTLLHTLNLTYLANQLLRDEGGKLNADEIYIFLMASALHDVGMGVADSDLDGFIDASGIRGYVNDHPDMSKLTLIRKFHNDFSFQFVKKYWRVFEIPNERYADAIAEVARGHRKTNLMDEQLYPTDFDLGDDRKANLALLAAVIRLADELDIAADRNSGLLYDIETVGHLGENAEFEFAKHEATHAVEFTEDTIVITAVTPKADITDGVLTVVRKVQETLSYCLSVIEARSDIQIDCRKTKLILNEKEVEIQ